MKVIGIDIETKSGADLAKCGVYKYVEDPDWEIQLFGYSIDSGPVKQVDFTKGEKIPQKIIAALQDKNIRKWAHNVGFERINLSRHIGLPSGQYIDPEGWYCTMVASAYNGLPRALGEVGKALKLPDQKLEEGKDLVRLFSVPRTPTKKNPSRWNKPEDYPSEWALYCKYNIRDVEVEDKLREILEMPPDSVWREMWENERINDRGVLIDQSLANAAIELDSLVFDGLIEEMKTLTGLENPNSPVQLKEWLSEQGIKTDTVGKDAVAELLKQDLSSEVRRVLQLRLQTGKTSAKKYQAMVTAVCDDGRLHGMFRFYGASRTGRFSGSIVQLQNLKRNSMPDLDAARTLVKQRNYPILASLYDDIPDVLGQLVRTAIVPPEGKLLAVADYSAIEARVLAWLSGEKWVLDAFRNGEDLYCATASKMYHCKVEKHGENGHLRQMGKTATLACGYSGGIGAIKAFAGDEISDSDAQDIVDSWREANPHTVQFWYALNNAAKDAVIQRVTTSVRVGQGQRIRFRKEGKWLLVDLPSGRHLSYYRPKIGLNKFGTETVNFVDPKTGVRIDVYGGVFAENCLAGDTMVVTDHGLVPIRNITTEMRIWDGKEYVTHEGVIFKGKKETVKIGSLRMTPDHKILTEKGWMECVKSNRFNWAEVSLPNGYQAWSEYEPEQSCMGMPMHLRERKDHSCCGIKERSHKVLRMYAEDSSFKSASNTWHDKSPGLGSLAFNEAEMRRPKSSCLSQLWSKGYHSLRKAGAFIRELLGRYGTHMAEGSGSGSHRQRQGLFSRQLPMDGQDYEFKKQAVESHHRLPSGQDDCGGVVGKDRDRRDDATLPPRSRLADRIIVRTTKLSEPVYDIRNCGPRHRFAVWDDGKARIVSNCTQALARDLLCNAMHLLEEKEYRVVGHIHDEVIVEVPADSAEKDLQEVEQLMADNPEWAKGLPLAAAGYTCTSYRKD